MNVLQKALGTISLSDEELSVGWDDAPFWLEDDGISVYIDSWPNGIRVLLRIFVDRMLPRATVHWYGPESIRELVDACRTAHVPASSYAGLETQVGAGEV
jgi:hypothetical protein